MRVYHAGVTLLGLVAPAPRTRGPRTTGDAVIAATSFRTFFLSR